MNKENMIKWAEALESGKYKQYRGGWNNDSGCGTATAHCCVDVACVIFTGADYHHNEGGAVDILSNSLDVNQEEVDCFIEMNDYKGYTFPQIAAHIRKMVEEA